MKTLKYKKIIGSSLLLTSFFAANVNAQTATNLLLNSAFESKLDKWTNVSAGTATSSGALSGAYSARVGTGNGRIVQDVTSRLLSGKTYTLSVKAKLASTKAKGYVAITFKNSQGTVLLEKKMDLMWASYQYYETVFTVPNGFTSAVVSLVKTSGSSTYIKPISCFIEFFVSFFAALFQYFKRTFSCSQGQWMTNKCTCKISHSYSRS